MPGGKKAIPGGSKSDNEQYEAVKEKLQKQGEPRAKEIAARIVNKRRSEEGRTKESSED